MIERWELAVYERKKGKNYTKEKKMIGRPVIGRLKESSRIGGEGRECT